ncbi:hypothetical protein [Neisseria weaveri]|uniref:hypothetical protein n=1 Tax=Neisseria weaveri TaxID=28091 RepID=UPI000D324CCD|nr:hypothetical protein [Neisseria weaveri]
MNKKMLLNSTLTLLSILGLSACGSGGGKAPEALPPKHGPHVNDGAKADNGKATVSPSSEASVNVPKAEEKKDNQAQAPKLVVPMAELESSKPALEKPKVAAPEAPTLPKFTDEQALKQLSFHDVSNGVFGGGLINLALSGQDKKINLQVLEPYYLVNEKVETLRDQAGNLVGYYGYVRVSEQKEDLLREEKRTDLRGLYIHDVVDGLQKQPVGVGQIAYKGKMLYEYAEQPNLLEADVSAIYYADTKRVSMDIHDRAGGKWDLRKDRWSRKHELVGVEDTGAVSGYLFFHDKENNTPKYNGNFTGGFYGENGSVLTGHATFENNKGGWKGVIGAVAEKSNTNKP